MWSRLARRRARPSAAGPGVIAAKVNGELRDLAYQVADGDVVEPVDIASDDGRYILRHSAAHVMAQAVQELFPQAKLGIGPPVENGFYYDFDVDEPFTPEDLKAIEGQDAPDRQAGPAVLPPGGDRRAGQVRARRRAVQARADRPQGPPVGRRRRVGRGRRQPS